MEKKKGEKAEGALARGPAPPSVVSRNWKPCPTTQELQLTPLPRSFANSCHDFGIDPIGTPNFFHAVCADGSGHDKQTQIDLSTYRICFSPSLLFRHDVATKDATSWTVSTANWA